MVKLLTLDFGSGHDLTVGEIKSVLGSELTVWSLLGILSLSLSLSLCPPPYSCTYVLSLSQKKKKKKKERKKKRKKKKVV